MTKVSVCIPAYNQTIHLKKTLDSIFIQSFDDYEIIVTDDSPNNSISDLISKYDFKGKLKYYHNEIALGPPKNWNECIGKASGEYIKIMHHDDWLSSADSLGDFVQAIESSQASMAFSNADVFYEKSNKTGFHSPGVESTVKLAIDPSVLFLRNFIGAPSMIMYKRDLQIQFDENLKWLVDIDFYIRYLKAHNSFVYIEKPLVTILAEGAQTVTSLCQDDKNIEVFENFYLFNKLKNGLNFSQTIRYSQFLVRLLQRFNITRLHQIKSIITSSKIPLNFKTIFYLSKLKAASLAGLRKTKRALLSPFKSKPITEKIRFQKQSYSQSGEDLIIDFIFNHIGISNPSYLDIGAHHPFYLSNTAHFYEKGCRGINIEPDPSLFKLFTEHRVEDLNLNIGISEDKGSADFYIISTPTLNTFSKEEAESYINEGDFRITSVVNIPTNSVKNIISEHNDGKFPHFLNIDAEGVDELIIRSIDYAKSYPLVICIETISFSTSGNGVKNTSISEFLKKNGYMIYADTNINTIFVREDAWRKK